MASSMVPARVSQSRARYQLRELTRSSLRCPYGAPQIASASADISASANVFTIARKQIRARRLQLLAQQPGRVHTLGCGHRIGLL